MIEPDAAGGHGPTSRPAESSASWFRQPVLATLMGSRPLALLATGLLTFQFAMASLGLPAIPCAVATLTPTHCPGCGVSRSIGALFRGDLSTSLSLHALGIPFLIGGLLIVAAALLPERPRDRLVGAVRRIELRTGVTALVLAGALVYWALRMASGHGRIEILG